MQMYLDNLGEKFICRDVRLVAQFLGCCVLLSIITIDANKYIREKQPDYGSTLCFLFDGEKASLP